MAHSKIKRIRIRQIEVVQQEWTDRWIDYSALRNAIGRFGLDVAEWGWLASLLGSILWVLLLLLQSDFSVAYEARTYLAGIGLYPPFMQLLVISMLLFLHGSVSLLVRYVGILPKSGRYGLDLVCIGLIVATLTMSGLFAADAQGVFHIFQDNSTEAQFGGLFNILTGGHGFYYAQLDWFSRVSLAFVLISIGITFLYISAANARIVPKWFSAIMVSTAVSFHVPKVLLDMGVLGPDLEYFIFGQNIFTGLLILFGANWIWTGVILLREQQKAPSLTLVPEG